MAKDSITFLIRQQLLLILLFVGLNTTAKGSDFSELDYTMADSIANAYHGETLYNLPLLVHKLTQGLDSDVEKFRSIYTWVCSNIENEFWYYNKNKKRQKKYQNDSLALAKWNNYLRPLVFEKLMKEKMTLCSGYAYLIKEMANFAELECEIIDGYGRNANSDLDDISVPNHSWNALKLEGKWYLCDATWSAGHILMTDKGTEFVAAYNEGYFLSDPRLFINNHYPLDKRWALLKEIPTWDDFTNGALVYNTAYSKSIIPLAPKAFHLDVAVDEILYFELEALADIDSSSIQLELNNLLGSRPLEIKELSQKNGQIFFSSQVPIKGLFALHIKIDGEYLLSYEVDVKRKKVSQ